MEMYFGNDYKIIADCLNDLADLYYKSGKYDEALP